MRGEWRGERILFGGEAGVGWRGGGGRAEKPETFGGEETDVSSSTERSSSLAICSLLNNQCYSHPGLR